MLVSGEFAGLKIHMYHVKDYIILVHKHTMRPSEYFKGCGTLKHHHRSDQRQWELITTVSKDSVPNSSVRYFSE